ncbi:MAG: hypothetical protein ACPL7B_16930 [Candidatus Poribacteria bacterium]
MALKIGIVTEYYYPLLGGITEIVSTPANVGGFELSAIAAFSLFIEDTETAISCAIALHLIEVVPIVIMGLVVLWYNGFSLLRIPKELPSDIENEKNNIS